MHPVKKQCPILSVSAYTVGLNQMFMYVGKALKACIFLWSKCADQSDVRGMMTYIGRTTLPQKMLCKNDMFSEKLNVSFMCLKSDMIFC